MNVFSNILRPTTREVLTSLVQGCLVGLAAGLLIGLFRKTHDLAYAPAHAWGTLHPVLWFIGLCLVALFVGQLMDRLPQFRSSGIPVVESIVEKDTPFPWFTIIWTKFVGTWLVLVGGLSVGREGPSIEMGASAGLGISNLLPRLAPKYFPQPSGPHTHGNLGLMAGAGAGLSAAFGAPLGGVAFVIEEMRCRCTPVMLISLTTAAVVADLTLGLFGLVPMFPFANATPLPLVHYWHLLPLGLILGLAGAGYNAVLLAATHAYTRAPFPPATRALLPLLAAGVLLYAAPSLLAGGEVLIRAQPEQASVPSPVSLVALLLAGKLLFSLLCAASSVPGGLLMPMLCLGGVSGVLLIRTALPYIGLPPLSAEEIQMYCILGMSAFFAASVRAPITGALLTIQMTGAYELTPATLLIAFIAAKTADVLKSPPIYVALRSTA